MPRHAGPHGRGELSLTADINVTSLVDVAFVLLIIFMITAPIMQGGVDVQLPRTEAQPIQPKEGLTITLDKDGVIYIDDDPLSYEEFRGSFQAIVEANDPAGVYFRGDGRASWADAARVLAVIRSAGIEDLGIVTEAEEIER
ncbi:MAG: biopolymer transporter ExbD [Gemmatimonadetes bacterium]|nr:biopolymer transporter ExbD [Gemmatimonadota bacterium]